MLRKNPPQTNPEPPKVHLGFCHDGKVHTDFAVSVLKWERWMVQHAGYLPSFSVSKNLYVAENRNRLAKLFLEHPAAGEWLWLLDPDIVFEPDDLGKLLAVASRTGAQIVAAAYWMNPHEVPEPALTWHAETREGLRLFRSLPPADRLVRLGSCGMGCTLIHRSVFEKLAEVHKDDPWTWFGHDRIGDEYAGEDVTFCRRARAQGFVIVGHCGVVVEHLKTMKVPHGRLDGNVD